MLDFKSPPKQTSFLDLISPGSSGFTPLDSTSLLDSLQVHSGFFAQVRVSGAQGRENEPSEWTWAASPAATPSPEAATIPGPVLRPPEDQAKGLGTRALSPASNIEPANFVHKGKRFLPTSCFICNSKAQKGWSLKSHPEAEGACSDSKQEGKRNFSFYYV